MPLISRRRVEMPTAIVRMENVPRYVDFAPGGGFADFLAYSADCETYLTSWQGKASKKGQFGDRVVFGFIIESAEKTGKNNFFLTYDTPKAIYWRYFSGTVAEIARKIIKKRLSYTTYRETYRNLAHLINHQFEKQKLPDRVPILPKTGKNANQKKINTKFSDFENSQKIAAIGGAIIPVQAEIAAFLLFLSVLVAQHGNRKIRALVGARATLRGKERQF